LQLQQVRQDINAVLEQYDKQHTISKQLKRKVDRSKHLQQDYDQLQQTLEQTVHQLNQCENEKADLDQ
jgi:hypothetical protein